MHSRRKISYTSKRAKVCSSPSLFIFGNLQSCNKDYTYRERKIDVRAFHFPACFVLNLYNYIAYSPSGRCNFLYLSLIDRVALKVPFIQTFKQDTRERISSVKSRR